MNILEQGVLFGRLCELLKNDYIINRAQRGAGETAWKDKLFEVCRNLCESGDLLDIDQGKIDFRAPHQVIDIPFLLRCLADHMSRDIPINPAHLEAILNKYGLSLKDE